jgi:hypothetical protein
MNILISFLTVFLMIQNDKPQQIPGKVECELYNSGGEGVAYHDTDAINNGSGKLNPADGSYLNEFRMKEGVDISYTKEKNIDNHSYNKVKPEMNQFYVGWTAPGEWIKFNVDVKETSEYSIDLMYTSHDGGTIAFDVDGNHAFTGKVPTTFDPADTIAWRQWHHWNKVDLGKMKLTKGPHILTLHTVTNGNMNYDYLEFRRN